jgi:hypothetical protein
MTSNNVKDVTNHELVGIEYSGDTPVLIYRTDDGAIHFSNLSRGITRLSNKI